MGGAGEACRLTIRTPGGGRRREELPSREGSSTLGPMSSSNLTQFTRFAAIFCSTAVSLLWVSSATAEDKAAPVAPAPMPAVNAAAPAKTAFKMPAWVSTEASALVTAQKPAFDAWYAGVQKKVVNEGLTSPGDAKRVALEILKNAQAQVGAQISELQTKAKQAMSSKLATAKTSVLQKGKEAVVGLSDADQLTLKNLTDKKSQLEQMLSELMKKTSDTASSVMSNLK
jgi:hypothetical protein